ncbi:helix-hairpin-helix domain-containing protein [Geobacillus proteiniphilus]|uniref:Helix-hairpin-helix domain-containing protein n=2 Tax=Geobacillus proteiniphilus TaxID=860353 RepID=A0ABY9MIR2_9BACL|nr:MULTISPECIES: helix-hairpin-helix domain-containing protein [Geobacillus]OPX04686.1 competence protein ComEA [Geobacillus sp. LEMMY01]WMJ17109.1 helix-hairpin-helix domain-containing protein [Geobacillus proteiniphilus]
MWEHVQEFGKRYGKAGVLLLFAAAAGLWVFRHPTDEKGQVVLPTAAETDAARPEEKKDEAPKTAVVDVKGAVAKPGVYEVAADARVRDVIALAGGLTNEADETKVNLAAKVRDEMMIYVPAKGEAAPAPDAVGKSPSDGARDGPQVAVNTATEEELMQLPGIGPAKAKAIIAYREEHGPFQRVEDLLNVTGIGEKTLEKLKPYLLVP